MTKSHLHRRRAARRTGYDEGLAAGEAERNNLKGKYHSIVVLLDAARSRIQHIFDHLDDEGDRVYLGSTNHRDWLRDMLDHMDLWSFDAMLPKGDINKMEGDPYAEIRAQRARAEAAEAEIDSRTRALDEAESEGTRLRDASANLIASASDTYKKRNGHLASFEDETGEKCWIVPFDAFEALRSTLSAQVQADSPAIKAIAAERRRQIEQEGWSAHHDDAHGDGSMALAAACYAMFAAVSDNARISTQLPGSLTTDSQDVEGWAAFLSIWPWERHFWKPTTRVRDLEKAGALIAAELDRVIRAAAPAKHEGNSDGR